MATDTTVNNLIINKLTKSQYDAIANPSDTELYLIPDEVDLAPTSGSSNCVTSGGVYSALSGKEDSTNKITSLSSSSTDTQYPSAKCVYDALSLMAKKVSIVNHGTSDTTFALTPNVLHNWGEVSSLTLTLATPEDNTIVNEYMFKFTSPSTPTTLSLPSSVNWAMDLSIEANKTYWMSILDDLAVWLTDDM